MLLKFSDFDLSNGVNSTDFVPTDRKPKFKLLPRLRLVSSLTVPLKRLRVFPWIRTLD